MKKKITAVMLVVLVGAMLFTSLTLAYFTDSGEAENVFTYGTVNIELTEDGWKDNPKYDSTKDKVVGVFPGESYKKIPYVKNTGDSDAFVRIGVKVNAMDLKAINSKAADFAIVDDELLDNLVDLQASWKFDDVDIVNGECTFWYNYGDSSILGAGATTSALFTTVTIPKELTYNQVTAAKEFNLTVIAQAVQTATFTDAAEAFAAAF